MKADYYEIRLCPTCGLRYPLIEGHSFGKRCPSCLGDTRVVLKREISTKSIGGASFSPAEKPYGLSVLLDNIRSAWNVGAIFRSADGLGVSKLYLCGITPTPENESMQKTSLGAEETVAWEYSHNALETVKTLKSKGHTLIALEQDERAQPIGSLRGLQLQQLVLIVGNEIAGVDPDLLDLCDHIVHIPMHGQKRSFNVEVAFAIAAYALGFQKA